MTDASNMRRFLTVLEKEAYYVGPKASDTVTYAAEQTKGKITKITATLKSYDSGRYTKLGRNLLRIQELTEEVKVLQQETKAEARELVADLFKAEDAACTRVVDTVGFMFHMSKDPEAVSSVSYAKVLKDLESHLTPELIKVLEALKAKHTSAPVQKAASLKATDKAPKTEESMMEGIGDKLIGFFKKLYQDIKAWGVGYDSKLDDLKAQMGMTEGLEEGWAEERQAFYAEIAKSMGQSLDDSLIDAIEAAAITQDEWAQNPLSCKQRIRGAQEEMYDFGLGEGSGFAGSTMIRVRDARQRNLKKAAKDYKNHGDIKKAISDHKLIPADAETVMKMAKKEVGEERVDELSRDTKLSYIDKAVKDVSKATSDHDHYVNKSPDSPFKSTHDREAEKLAKRGAKRLAGINKAARSLGESDEIDYDLLKQQMEKDRELRNKYDGYYQSPKGGGYIQGWDYENEGNVIILVDTGTGVRSKDDDSKATHSVPLKSLTKYSYGKYIPIDESKPDPEEFNVFEDQTQLTVKSFVKINAPRSNAHGEYGMIDSIDEAPEEEGGNQYKVVLVGTGFWAMYDEDELEPATKEDVYRAHRQPSPTTEDVEVVEAKKAEWKLNSIGDKALKTMGYEGNYSYNERSKRYDWIVLAPDHTIVDSGTTPDYSEMDSSVRNAIKTHRDSLKEDSISESTDCDHEWVEGVDDDGNLAEPAYDVCVDCGETR